MCCWNRGECWVDGAVKGDTVFFFLIVPVNNPITPSLRKQLSFFLTLETWSCTQCPSMSTIQMKITIE
jgi:hypothetical protein